MSDWQVFQRDVLDVLRQYEGFFDFFERVGSLSDDSRPDCFGRITREDKKEIWVIDAKNKGEIDSEDTERMDKYLKMLRSNPIDTGLEISELSEHEFRGIFVTSSRATELEEYESVRFNAFHQFLQKELVYTDTDKVVRDVSKMVERKQLSQSQARLLFQSLKPFEKRISRAVDVMEKIESEYQGLEVEKPPLDSYDFDIPVDMVVTHTERDQTFLFDIPYSWDAVKKVDEKVEEVKKRIEGIDREVFYAAINTFKPHDSEFILQPEEVERDIMETAGVISRENIVELFEPKIKTKRNYKTNYIEVKDTQGLGFTLRVMTSDDVDYKVEVEANTEAISRMEENMANSMKEFGKTSGKMLQHEFTVTEDLEIEYNGSKETLSSYKDTVRSIYQAAVNPTLSKKVKNRF